MCVLGISGRACISTLQKLAMGLYLAVKNIPACSSIKCLTKTIYIHMCTSGETMQLTGREMDMSWVLVVGSVSGNSAKGPETWHGFAFDVETPHSQSYKSICLKLY